MIQKVVRVKLIDEPVNPMYFVFVRPLVKNPSLDFSKIPHEGRLTWQPLRIRDLT